MVKDRIVSAVEYFMALAFLGGGISMFFVDTSGVDNAGPLVRWLGSEIAAIVYGLWFITLASWLFLSKIFGLNKVKKHALMAVYITSVWVFLLELLLLGWTPFLVDELVLGALAGILWLRLKMRTEYKDAEDE